MSDPVTTTDTFLDAVIPKGHRYIGFTNGKTNHAGRPIINCSPFEQAVQGVNIASRKSGEDVYFALASFKEPKIYDQERGFMKSYRKEENVDKLKAIWLDVDFKSYDMPEDCVKDIGRFLEDFPSPTFVVNSGGGVHLYWCFEEELTPTQWMPLAQGLAAIAKQRGLRADYGVTIDSARVLRLPGTRNQKYDHKPECRIAGMGNYAHVARMEELLRPHAAGQTHTQAKITAPANVVNLFDPAANSDLSSGYTPGKVADFAQIAKHCPTVADSLHRAGDGDSYVLWKDLLHLAAFCDDGIEAAVSISNGDARYDETVMRDFFDQSVKTKTEGKRGPTSCQKFSATSNKCATCQYLGKIKGPWVLGVVEEKNEDEPSFTMNGETHVLSWQDNDDGTRESIRKKIFDAELSGWRYVPTTDPENPYTLRVDVSAGKTHTVLEFTASELSDPRAFKHVFIAKGLGVQQNLLRPLQDTTMAWVTHLTRQKEHTKFQKFGWSDDEKAFVLGQHLITEDGEQEIVNTAFVDHGTEFNKTGDIEPWRELSQLLLDDDEASFTYLFCAGMAGPLMGILGQHCSLSISAFSPDSGAGKTTVLKAIQGAFGDPRGTMALSDTANFITARIGALSGVPALWDEIRGTDRAEAVTQVMFALSEGKTKGRLSSNADMKSQQRLNTMLICCSNTPISDYVNQRVSGTNAGMARFMEFEMASKRKADTKISGLVTKLDRNFGHFGGPYIQTILKNMAGLKAQEENILAQLAHHRDWAPEERFWMWGTAKILLAGAVVNKTGILNVDMAKLMTFALDLVKAQKEEMVQATQQEDVILSKIVRFYADELITTEHYQTHTESVRVERSPRGHSVSVHLSTADKQLFIGNTELRKFCRESDISFKNTKLHLERRFEAKPMMHSMGAGTQFAMGRTHGLMLDLTKMNGEDLLLASPTGSGSSSTSSQPAKPDS